MCIPFPTSIWSTNPKVKSDGFFWKRLSVFQIQTTWQLAENLARNEAVKKWFLNNPFDEAFQFWWLWREPSLFKDENCLLKNGTVRVGWCIETGVFAGGRLDSSKLRANSYPSISGSEGGMLVRVCLSLLQIQRRYHPAQVFCMSWLGMTAQQYFSTCVLPTAFFFFYCIF